MNGFLGQYEYQLDEKGRVSLPAAFRKEAEADRFVLLQWRAPALTLFPDETWADVRRRLVEYRRAEPEAWSHVLGLTSRATEVSPDKQGRILVPAWLQKAASLDGKVLLVGAIDRVELWNPDLFATQVSSGTEALERFAHQIFG